MAGPAHTQPLPEQWNGIERALDDQVFHEVRFLVDGYRITAMKGPVSKNRLAIVIYVNGEIRGEWVTADDNGKPKEVARRFWRQRRKALVSPRNKAEIVRRFGKRKARQLFPNLDKVHSHWLPEWNSARSFRRHLVKHNDSIRVLGPTEAWPE